MRSLVIVVLVILAACDKGAARSSPGVKLETACKVDDDCALLGSMPPECCSACGPQAFTRASVEAANARCQELSKGRKDYFEHCPHLDCACQRSTARCKANTCVVETTGCQPMPPEGAGSAPSSP